MEFYFLRFRAHTIAKGLVSIPNGMEFYLVFRLKEQRFVFVSIPNGMEFYEVPQSAV